MKKSKSESRNTQRQGPETGHEKSVKELIKDTICLYNCLTKNLESMSILSCDDCERDKLEYDDVKNMSPFKRSSWSEYSYKDVCILPGLKAGEFEIFLLTAQ